jgi:hypothetical protein
MRQSVRNVLQAFPVQLFVLHFRKYQILLGIWALLFSTVNSGFLHSFGADALFFAPDYLGSVNALGTAIIGLATGVYFMSWNITTFILHSKRCRFLATTDKPFLKYCINNSALPLLFTGFYMVRMVQFNSAKELMAWWEVTLLLIGFLGGLVLLLLMSFGFFFGAEKTIVRTMQPATESLPPIPYGDDRLDNFGMKVSFYLSTGLRWRKTRNVAHYSKAFLDKVFKRHHLAGMVSIVLAFGFLTTVGFLLDNKLFELPAAASALVFFAVLTAVIGALTYFLQSWSVLFVIILAIVANILYKREILDPRNKAYGIDYANRQQRPAYDKAHLQRLCTPQNMAADKASMIQVLDNWKRKQKAEKPLLVIINVSGGGLRSATFTMHTLQQLDSLTNGQMMRQTFMITGASGGMLAAAYFRELYRQQQKGQTVDLHNLRHTYSIAQDLLNPMFTSMIARDIFAPAQKFSVGPHQYVKDRGYAFEQKLNENTGGIMNLQMKALAEDERNATVPMMIFNSVITRDGRKMMLCTQPLRFMMKPALMANDTTASPDAVDFSALFAGQGPLDIRLLTALRMNATFPYVLPNVWLPSEPVIDVMDAGLRDNFGQETALRLVDHCGQWIKDNTSGVLLLQLRDRMNDNWQQPLGTGSITDILLKPATMLQNNWYKLQDFFQTDQYSYLQQDSGLLMRRLTFMYIPQEKEKGAALNFHLTARERRDVMASFFNQHNQVAAAQLKELIR